LRKIIFSCILSIYEKKNKNKLVTKQSFYKNFLFKKQAIEKKIKYINMKDKFNGFYDIDPEFYKSYYQDLSDLSPEVAIYHYENYGKHENRIINNIQLFYKTYPEFDVDFYKKYYTDLTPLSNELVLYHYDNYGKHENRLINKKQHFIQSYPDFDVDFYKTYYKDISHLRLDELLDHYETCGKYEKRFMNKNQMFDAIDEEIISKHNSYSDIHFDVDFYRAFNEELKEMDNNQLLRHYYFYGTQSNDNFLNYDFIINDNYEIVSKMNEEIKSFFTDHSYFRSIDSYDKLINYRKQYEKKYYIYNKESFYKCYTNFNYEYYKNRYFNNNNISEKEVLLYYHTKGKYEKQAINEKINLILYIPPYDIKCGGITVVHYFAKLINEMYSDKFCAKLFMLSNIKYKNPFCNEFAKLEDINDNSVVIYPEIIPGNPLNAKNVVRWILLELGIEMPLSHSNSWGRNDLIYHWETHEKQLACPFFNNIFTNKKLNKRTKTCYLIKKGRLLHKNIRYMHPGNSVCIDDLSLQEIRNIFNESQYFYSYDPNSAYIIYAAVCGCIPIIHKIDGVNEDDYFKSKMYNFDNNIYNKGIVYGNNPQKIKHILDNKLYENNEEYYKELFSMFVKKTIPIFLNDIKNIFI